MAPVRRRLSRSREPSAASVTVIPADSSDLDTGSHFSGVFSRRTPRRSAQNVFLHDGSLIRRLSDVDSVCSLFVKASSSTRWSSHFMKFTDKNKTKAEIYGITFYLIAAAHHGHVVCVSKKCVITHAKSSYIRQEKLVGGKNVSAKRSAAARAAMCLLWIFTPARFCGQTSPFSPVCPYASEHGGRGEVGAFPCLLASSSYLLLSPIFL